MDKDKLRELVLKHLAELLDETSATGGEGYLTKAFARKPTSQDTNAPAGFESMPKSGNVYKKMGFRIVKPNERIDAKDLWKGEHLEERIRVELKNEKKKEPINEVRYSQFKTETRTRTPQQQLHEGVKKIQRNLDEINKLVEFVTRMKTELKGDAEQMNYLKRTHNALFKINDKIQDINNKIKGLTE
jgi:predicted RNase H-like nuclease (RuvC/YqgF family)